MGNIKVSDAIVRPFTHFSRLFLGAILSLIPVLNLFSVGYLIKCINKPGMPAWSLNVFLKGLLALIIAFVYAIPASILFGFVSMMNLPYDNLFMIPFLVLVMITGYIIPAAIINFAKNGFFFKNVFKKAFSPEYFIAFLLGLFWAGLLNFISVAAMRILFFVLPLSIFIIVSVLISSVLFFASEITFISLLSEAS
ncbi:DUF4013 domain-containing protein [Candidatus Woesearchaeota archaeon]|nr:DUF4013 domain-containing protein [Candidatus Woesearchaeota archaeon]